MDANEILKRDAELREDVRFEPFTVEETEDREEGLAYLASIAAAERALIEAAAALYAATGGEFTDSPICIAYRALLAAMEEAQR